jgi:hypothetical protein
MSPAENFDDHLSVCANRTLHHISKMRKSGKDGRPFFFAVGFHKPHIPWNVPQEWYDRYPLDTIALAPNRLPPSGTPDVALNNILSGYWSDTFSDFGALRSNGTISGTNPWDESALDA